MKGSIKSRGGFNIRRQGGWLQIAALALSAIGVVSSFVGQKKASDAAKEQSQQEAEYERKVTRERIRQLGIEERVMRGETLASYAGSGVMANTPTASLGDTSPFYGSPLAVIQEQAKEFQAQRKITEEVGATRVQQALTGGKSTADYYRYSGYANTAAGISDILTQIHAIKNP